MYVRLALCSHKPINNLLQHLNIELLILSEPHRDIGLSLILHHYAFEETKRHKISRRWNLCALYYSEILCGKN